MNGVHSFYFAKRFGFHFDGILLVNNLFMVDLVGLGRYF